MSPHLKYVLITVFAAFGVLFFGVGNAVILFCLEKFTKAFGIRRSIFKSYGVVDHHPDEFDENETMALLASKNNEIVLLKQEILVLENIVKKITIR
jgi:hypothetical protein